MKKVGIIIFILAVVTGVVLANVVSFGRLTGKLVNFKVDFGRVAGSGNVVTQKRDVSDFTTVEVKGAFDVEIVAQKDFGVEIEGDDNLLEFIRTDVGSGVLEISSEKSFSTNGRIKVRVSAPNIEDLDLSGASNVSLSGLANDSMKVHSSGASKIKLAGETREFEIKLSGASKVEATDLKSVNVRVDSSGASHAKVFVTGDLNVDLSGASKVTYFGNPQNISKDLSGASSVNPN